LADRSMRTRLVEVFVVVGQHPTHAAFTENEGVIQAFLPDRSHPSLRAVRKTLGPRPYLEATMTATFGRLKDFRRIATLTTASPKTCRLSRRN
jgi:hypothetical protein